MLVLATIFVNRQKCVIVYVVCKHHNGYYDRKNNIIRIVSDRYNNNNNNGNNIAANRIGNRANFSHATAAENNVIHNIEIDRTFGLNNKNIYFTRGSCRLTRFRRKNDKIPFGLLLYYYYTIGSGLGDVSESQTTPRPMQLTPSHITTVVTFQSHTLKFMYAFV